MLQVYWNGKKIDDIEAFCRERGWKVARVRVVRKRPVSSWRPEAQDLIGRLARTLARSKDFETVEEVLFLVEDWLCQQGYREERVEDEELGTELVPEPLLQSWTVWGGDWNEPLLLEVFETERERS